MTLPIPMQISATIIHGNARGKTLNCPTANLDLTCSEKQESIASWEHGVYAGWARLGDSPVRYKAACSLGKNPHFENTQVSLEVHLLEYSGADFYGALLHLELVTYLRPQEKYENLQSLVAAIEKDKVDAFVATAVVGEPSKGLFGPDTAWASDDDLALMGRLMTHANNALAGRLESLIGHPLVAAVTEVVGELLRAAHSSSRLDGRWVSSFTLSSTKARAVMDSGQMESITERIMDRDGGLTDDVLVEVYQLVQADGQEPAPAVALGGGDDAPFRYDMQISATIIHTNSSMLPRNRVLLNCPTAKLDVTEKQDIIASWKCGAYAGWARLGDCPVRYKAVCSLGKRRNGGQALEVHMMEYAGADIYGAILHLDLVKYLRPQEKYEQLEALVAAIEKDKVDALVALDGISKIKSCHATIPAVSGAFLCSPPCCVTSE